MGNVGINWQTHQKMWKSSVKRITAQGSCSIILHKMNLLNPEALKVSEYKHLLNSETPNHLHQWHSTAHTRKVERPWHAGKPPINTNSGKTSNDYSASLAQYRRDGVDLLICALTQSVLTNKQAEWLTHALTAGSFFVNVSKCDRCSRSISRVRIISEKQARRNTFFSDASSAQCGVKQRSGGV